MTRSRVEAESIIQALTGGTLPDDGDTLVFDKIARWRFGSPESSATLDFVAHPVGYYIVSSISSYEPFGFRVLVDPTSVYQSVNVSYNDGGGIEAYTFDVSTPTLHTLKLSNGTTPWTAGRTQTSFTITLIPYTGTGGGGDAGDPVYVITGDAARSGRGVTVEQRDTTLRTYNFLKTTAPFDWETDTGDDNEGRLKLTATYNAGSQSGTWNPSYNNGPTQRVSLSNAMTLGDITGMVDGGTMNIHFTLNSYTLTISGTYYEGPTLSFSTEDYVALSIVDFGLSKLVIAGVEYT